MKRTVIIIFPILLMTSCCSVTGEKTVEKYAIEPDVILSAGTSKAARGGQLKTGHFRYADYTS